MPIGDTLRTFASPDTSPAGVAWDGHALWHCDTAADLIYQLNPFTGAVLRSFASPGGDPQGLAWDGHALWTAGGGPDLIYQVALN